MRYLLIVSISMLWLVKRYFSRCRFVEIIFIFSQSSFLLLLSCSSIFFALTSLLRSPSLGDGMTMANPLTNAAMLTASSAFSHVLVLCSTEIPWVDKPSKPTGWCCYTLFTRVTSYPVEPVTVIWMVLIGATTIFESRLELSSSTFVAWCVMVSW